MCCDPSDFLTLLMRDLQSLFLPSRAAMRWCLRWDHRPFPAWLLTFLTAFCFCAASASARRHRSCRLRVLRLQRLNVRVFDQRRFLRVLKDLAQARSRVYLPQVRVLSVATCTHRERNLRKDPSWIGFTSQGYGRARAASQGTVHLGFASQGYDLFWVLATQGCGLRVSWLCHSGRSSVVAKG